MPAAAIVSESEAESPGEEHIWEDTLAPCPVTPEQWSRLLWRGHSLALLVGRQAQWGAGIGKPGSGALVHGLPRGAPKTLQVEHCGLSLCHRSCWEECSGDWKQSSFLLQWPFSPLYWQSLSGASWQRRIMLVTSRTVKLRCGADRQWAITGTQDLKYVHL